LTEEQQGGTAPEPEAIASEETPASEETVAAIAVADEPAAPETSPEPVLASEEDVADAPPAAEEEDEEPAPVVRRTGPEPTTMEELLAEQDSDIKSFKHGDVVEGTVVRIDKDEMLVDIGAKS
jgi:hypothetical protein